MFEKGPRGGRAELPLVKKRPAQQRRSSILALVLLSVTLASIQVFKYSAKVFDEPSGHSVSKPWSWDAIHPSIGLNWEKCYDNEFECARLDVPMDWREPTDQQRVVLGVIKLPAKSQGAFPPVFVNPGGPGGSGISFLHNVGKELQTIIGDNHDLISFDPRGVGVSTPRVECWGTAQKRKLWSLQETPVIDERPGLIYDAYARAVAESVTCERALNETGILRHLSSASLARDMLEILDKTGHEKLRYWGFSYGTILGGVFAGLFPDRVERLISDGNCDYDDWFKMEHMTHLLDTDLIFDAFDRACHKVGHEKCAFWASSPEAIQKRRSSLLEKLKKSPVIVPAWAVGDGPELPEIITYSKVQLFTRLAIYKPLVMFPALAEVYAGLERGDGLHFYEILQNMSEDMPSKQFCSLKDRPATQPLETGMEMDAFAAIMCSDGEDKNSTIEDIASYAEKIVKMSRWAGAANLQFGSVCAGRTVRPKWRFSEGDFKGDTAFPILFIGNMADNVTPLQSARNNSARFPSSVVLQGNLYGHCSLSSASKCIAHFVRGYFQNGTLPEPGTECEPDYDLFELPSEEDMLQQDEVSRALLDLSHKVDFSS